MKSYKCALVLVVFVLMALPVRGQSTLGSILGTARDETGAVVPGAQIEVTNLDTNVKRGVTSNETGQYSILNLLEGRYSLVATRPGFATTRVGEIVLNASQERRIDVVIRVATAAETVQVETAISAVNTENATVAHTVGSDTVLSLPLNSRGNTTSPLAAIVAMPNVQQDTAGNISLGGTLPYMTRYSVDGTNNNSVLGGGARGEAQTENAPSMELLGEFKISAVGNNAEFMSPGDVTITTKGGTNAFHGSLFEYHQNRALDARTYGSPTKQAKIWNTFGGSLGGPIIRNKTFFFADYEGNRKPGSALITGSVPTAAMRSGNLAGLPGPAVIDPTTGQPFPNNQIPADRINTVAKIFLNNYYPLPNFASASTANNYRFQVPTPTSQNGYDVRVDENLGSNDQIFVRWDWKNISTVQTNGLLPAQPVPITNRNLTVANTHIFSPNLLNEFRFGFARAITDSAQIPFKGKDVVTMLGFQGVDLAGPVLQGGGPFPVIDFSDGTSFTSVGQNAGIVFLNRVAQVVDNFSWTKGKHTMKFGGHVYWDHYTGSASIPGDEIGKHFFNQGSFSKNAYSDFLLGLPTSVFIWAPSLPSTDGKTPRAGFFAQDAYRITPRLTVGYGLRYDLLPQVTETTGNTSSFLETPAGTGTIIFPPAFKIPNAILSLQNLCAGAEPGWTGVPNPPFPCTPVSRNYGPRVIQTDYKDFAPRISAAFRPFSNNKTVVRAGYGLFTVANSSGSQGYTYAGSVVPNYFLFNADARSL